MRQGAAGDVGEDLLYDGVVAVLPFGLEIISSNGESVNTAWYRQTGNSSSRPVSAFLLRSRTRRMISRAVTAWPFFDANAVYSTSATSASETQAPSWSSQIARGYRIGIQALPGMAAIAARMLALAGGGDREPGAAAADRADHRGVIERRVQPDDDRAGAAGLPRGADGPGGQAGRAARRGGVAAACLVAAITGADSGVLTVAASAFSPRTSRLLPWILVCPNRAPCFLWP